MRRFFCFLFVLLLPVFLHSQSHVLRQLVSDWSVGHNETDAKWVVYDVTNPAEDVLDESSIGSFTIHSGALNAIRWNANTGNFPTPWQNGDRLLHLGSWDSAPLSFRHTGYYWVFNDTLDATQDPQTWEPSDTLREISVPWLEIVGDTIIMRWLKPYETGGTYPDTLNVMGFKVYVDTTGTDLPYLFHERANVPNTPGSCHPGTVQDTLCYVDYLSNYSGSISGLRYAVKLVSRPDTGGVSGEGYETYHLSKGSDFHQVSGYPLLGKISDWPLDDTVGVFWGVYKMSNPAVDYLTRSSFGSYEYYWWDTLGGGLEWYQDGGRFGSGWMEGDELLGFVEYEDGMGTVDHVGYYTMGMETLGVELPETFTSSMGLMPVPWVDAEHGSSGDTVYVDSMDTEAKWLSGGAGVAGYIVYRDTTGSGMASAYEYLDYVIDVGSDTVVYVDNTIYPEGMVLYYGIKLVYEPGLAGHISVYLSGNSNPVQIYNPPGCEEEEGVKGKYSFSLKSNVVSGPIEISLVLPREEKIKLSLVGIDGRIIETVYEGKITQGNHSISYTPSSGNGIYFLIFEREGKMQSSSKVIYMR